MRFHRVSRGWARRACGRLLWGGVVPLCLAEYLLEGVGLRVEGVGFRLRGGGLGVKVMGSGFRVRGLGLGFKVMGIELWIKI